MYVFIVMVLLLITSIKTLQNFELTIIIVIASIPGADPEKIELGGANSMNYQTEPAGGANLLFFV